MKHADFVIGTEFQTCTGQRWRCTDVGQRSILAIELRSELEDAWFYGPPYAVQEVVFDEVDIKAAFRSHEEAILDALVEVDRDLHPGYPHEVVNTMMEARLTDDSRQYPRQRLLRVDRVNGDGEILHPYAAEPAAGGWQILIYAPFTMAFTTIPEAEFVRLRPARQPDLQLRRRARGL